MEFQAIIHGAKIEKNDTQLSDSASSPQKQQSLMKFGDPEDYKNMPMEERESLTEKMMGVHKAWAAKTPLSS